MARHEDLANKPDTDGQDVLFDARMAELVLLHSMYPDQLDLNDARLQAAVQSEDVSAECTQEISGLFLVDQSLEVYFSLAAQYPERARPTIHCRIVNGSLSRCLQKKLNEDIAPLVRQQDASLIDILQSIMQQWTEEQKISSDAQQSSCQTESTAGVANGLCRYWIYSHHIKSKVKRKLVIDQCEQLHLSGAMLIGKPGLICIEGTREDCDILWSQIRRLTWQRISLIETEILPQDAPRAFDTFEENSDRSALFHILQSKGCDGVLKNFFGF